MHSRDMLPDSLLAHIRGAAAYAIDRRPLRIILLHNEPLRAGLARRLDQLGDRQPSFANRGVEKIWVGAQILEVDGRNTAAVALEEGGAVLARRDNPAQVDLGLEQIGIGRVEQDLVTGLAVELLELEGVIVIGELEGGLLTLRADRRQQLAQAPIVVGRFVARLRHERAGEMPRAERLDVADN